MFLLNKQDIYIGYVLNDFNKVRETLELEGIKYTYKVINHSGEWIGHGTARSNLGSCDFNTKYEKLYSVSVKNADFEKAKYLINSKLHF